MTAPKRILLLAGTAEARALAGRLWDMPGIAVTASLAGATERPASLPVAETRIGGFGGPRGLARYLDAHDIAAVVDATHPFAALMPQNTADACAAAQVPRLRLLRPPWPVREGWTLASSLAEAAEGLPTGARVFLTAGRGGIAPFAARRDLRVLARSIDDPGELPEQVISIRGRPPFTYASEFAVMCSHRVTHLVTKNAGGCASAKLDAAEALGVRVVAIERPPQPDGPVAQSVAEAVAWLHANVGFGN